MQWSVSMFSKSTNCVSKYIYINAFIAVQKHDDTAAIKHIVIEEESKDILRKIWFEVILTNGLKRRTNRREWNCKENEV